MNDTEREGHVSGDNSECVGANLIAIVGRCLPVRGTVYAVTRLWGVS